MKIKLRNQVVPEKIIQKSILEYLSWQRGIYYFRAGAGAVKIEGGGFFKTGRAGLPDIIVLKDGRFIGLEVKTTKGVQSQFQKDAEEDIKKAGGEYYIVKNIDDVLEALKDKG